MVTLCSVQDVLDRCGADASPTIIASSAIVERYIETAEQTIVLETRRAWVDEYASVLDSTKETLKICTASHAAKEIIAYDPKGFAPSSAWITMLNVVENAFQRTLKALKDLDSVKIRSVS